MTAPERPDRDGADGSAGLPVRALVRELALHCQRLIQAETALAQRELAEALQAYAWGLVLLAMGTVIVLMGTVMFLVAGSFLLSLVLPVWIAAVVVGALVVAGGGLVLLRGWHRVRHRPFPRTIATLGGARAPLADEHRGIG